MEVARMGITCTESLGGILLKEAVSRSVCYKHCSSLLLSSVGLHKTRLLDTHYLAENKLMGSQQNCFPSPGKRIHLAV